MRRYSITTLGCKVNQCESSALGGLLEASGYRLESLNSNTDLIVINTCTVTGRAAMQSRQAIRQALRNHPNAKIVVTGCYAQTAPDEIGAINGVDYIVGHSDKMEITRLIEQLKPSADSPVIIHQDIQHSRCFDPMPSVVPNSRTRAFLKIQDGCNSFCTYCIVPYARGRSRSMPVADVLDHLRNLFNADFKEIVLTGIHLGIYGKDLTPRSNLHDLLSLIPRQVDLRRIRLSSIEPNEIDNDIIDIMAAPNSRLCPHLHIPLQSGDNSILKRMGRSCTREQFSKKVEIVRHAMPHAAIGTDVLVGFPGEDDDAFTRTLTFIESVDISYLHVFPFSPRSGTPAANFKNKVPDRVVKERCRQLRDLGEKKKAAFYRSNINQRVNILIEHVDTTAGSSRGISDNYIPVSLPDTNANKNTVISVRIQSVEPDLTVIGTSAEK